MFLLPLACWARPGSAFAEPKMVLLAILDLMLAAAWLGTRNKPSAASAAAWPALAWVAAVSISSLSAAVLTFDAVLLALLPVPLFWWIAQARVPLPSLARAVWLGTTGAAAIVVLQFCGLDPLNALGWQPEAFPALRMRAYGTMGNPDFVAAWCCAALPLGWREIAVCHRSAKARVLPWGAAAVQIAAILATASRVFALAIILHTALAAWRSKRRLWLCALPLAAAVLFLSPARPLTTTLQGRLYLAQVIAPHWQTPLAGYGPGAFEKQFAAWQAGWLRVRQNDPGPARFAGPLDHAHNDYLEFLVEFGPVGLIALLGCAGWVMVRLCRRPAPALDSVEFAAAAGAATLFLIAAVDFPFHRPAEWSLLWLFLGILAAARSQTQGA